eukprot:639093-Amphidinium_carterae.1
MVRCCYLALSISLRSRLKASSEILLWRFGDFQRVGFWHVAGCPPLAVFTIPLDKQGAAFLLCYLMLPCQLLTGTVIIPPSMNEQLAWASQRRAHNAPTAWVAPRARLCSIWTRCTPSLPVHVQIHSAIFSKPFRGE